MAKPDRSRLSFCATTEKVLAPNDGRCSPETRGRKTRLFLRQGKAMTDAKADIPFRYKVIIETQVSSGRLTNDGGLEGYTI
eukprot:scaffold2366_cov159-Amphora_coffeaeformis.AAC.23